MARKRTTHTPQFKAKVALEAAREQYTISELARKYSLHPNVIRGWKKQLVEHLPEIFRRPGPAPGSRRMRSWFPSSTSRSAVSR